jgi:hypothetical protein
LTAWLRVLASDLDPETIRPKRIYRRNRYFARNELVRLCLTAFRTAAGESITIHDITHRVIDSKGFDTGDSILRAAIRDQVADVIRRLHKNNQLEKIWRGRAIRWKLR